MLRQRATWPLTYIGLADVLRVSPNTFSNWSYQSRARQPFLRGLSHQYKDVLSCYGVTKYQDADNENATPPVLTFAPNSINTLLRFRTQVVCNPDCLLQTLKPPAFDSVIFYVGTQFWKSGLNFKSTNEVFLDLTDVTTC